MQLFILVQLLVGFFCVGSASRELRDDARRRSTSLQKRTLSDSSLESLLETIESATTCNNCSTILKTLKSVAQEGDDTFAEVLIEYCVATGSGTTAVCKGFMTRESHSMAQSLRTMTIPSTTSETFCMILFGLCNPGIESWDMTFPKSKLINWNIKSKSTKSKTLKVIHISDIHVDLNYTTGASYNCTEMVCCRPYTAAEAPGNTSYPAGAYGNPNCESPLALEKSMYAAIRKLVPDASLTLFTGDIVEGAEDLTTNAGVVTDINSAYSHMLGLPYVYAAVGNHESNPVNSFPPSGVNAQTYGSQYVYDALAENWLPWIGSYGASQAQNYAAYSVKHQDTNLRVISINTMFWMKENYWIYQKTMPKDPNSQFEFLIKELAAAEKAGERVWIIGHIPPGRPDMLSSYSLYFDQIVQKYHDTIAALFWGHTHKDQFEVAYSTPADPTAKSATAINYIAPAMVPSSGNPTFRVYSVDPDTWEVLDYTVYIANMSAPSYQQNPVWEKYYSAKEEYGKLVSPKVTAATAVLTPSFWHKLSEAFESDDDAFQAYYARKTRGYDVSECDSDCKATEICQMRASQAQYNCVDADTPISIKKRAVDVHEESGECKGSLLMRMMQNLGAEGMRKLLVRSFGTQ